MIFLNVSFHLSTIRDDYGCPGVLNLGVTPNIFKNSFVKLDVKLVPWSLVMTDGTPTSMNKFFNSSHTAFAVKDFSRYTAGHRVHESTMHKQYLWPAADVGSIGPTTSIVTRLKATSSPGIGVIGTLSITKLLAFN